MASPMIRVPEALKEVIQKLAEIYRQGDQRREVEAGLVQLLQELQINQKVTISEAPAVDELDNDEEPVPDLAEADTLATDETDRIPDNTSAVSTVDTSDSIGPAVSSQNGTRDSISREETLDLEQSVTVKESSSRAKAGRTKDVGKAKADEKTNVTRDTKPVVKADSNTDSKADDKSDSKSDSKSVDISGSINVEDVVSRLQVLEEKLAAIEAPLARGKEDPDKGQSNGELGDE